ncbi:MAG: geranylgeranylglyceryl/heptaprenylglyceryl phosphate synthase [Sulfolobales archaeon]|nr:geranylgeranylglyceryl/heptaprenylglyceryl phosphate synthase [Sulfolobales archaeon]MCX8198553.1 geranylgeranylglyceryl/heptaprenylglyceryl phosphate synthase [Sulfolobales archaeon]MDW8169626.1 geranylgeranylglyceryl/heptaprenylglyceryl phosphate synthase [Desulfurococcaceae archaeon]
MTSRIHKYIVDKLKGEGKLHFTLIDPAKSISDLEKIAGEAASAGTDAFLVGGSLAVTPEEAGSTARALKKHGLPVIVFPGNLNCLTPEADAVLFVTLMNSAEPYYIMGAQVQGALLVKRYGLEALPTGYVVVYGSTAVAHVGRVIPIPEDRPEIIAAYALAAEMMGMKYFYIEGGSGAPKPAPYVFPSTVKKYTKELIVIVGGGIREPDVASRIASAGADIIVTGTIVEEDYEKAVKIIKAVKAASSTSS